MVVEFSRLPYVCFGIERLGSHHPVTSANIRIFSGYLARTIIFCFSKTSAISVHDAHPLFILMDRPRTQSTSTDSFKGSQVKFRPPAPAFVNPDVLRSAENLSSSRRHELHTDSFDTNAELFDANAPTTAPPQPITDAEQQQQTENVQEEKQMFFYYPKYLDADAVVLIARTLLRNWESGTALQGTPSAATQDELSPSPQRQENTPIPAEVTPSMQRQQQPSPSTQQTIPPTRTKL